MAWPKGVSRKARIEELKAKEAEAEAREAKAPVKTWGELTRRDNRSSAGYSKHYPPDTPVEQIPCSLCRTPIWTPDPKEDVCEACWILHVMDSPPPRPQPAGIHNPLGHAPHNKIYNPLD
jgi:hypothetical protein